MSTLYEISSLIAFIMNKPNNFAQIIGSLRRGAQIDVISISGSWHTLNIIILMHTLKKAI